ncbi:MAG: hypothetical protein JWO36_3729 [Myxococcales bacterium]|nr:hypothetical protein [Myxococcales bacterium]
MKNVIARSLSAGVCAALVIGTVHAQPAPPTRGSGSGSGSGSGTTTPAEKAGTNETLSKGGDTRPWAAGVAPNEQKSALQTFHDGNLQLNDGLFAKAAEKYRDALKHWDHPAIHYNLALAEMNLDQPIQASEDFDASVRFGEAPLQSKDKFDNAKGYLLLLKNQIAEVEVTCNKTGAKVMVDSQLVFTAPGTYKGKVRAGKHTFVAELEGHPTRIDAPYISPGPPFRIELKLYTARELTRYHRKWQKTWVPYVVIGSGALIGAISGIVALSATNDYASYDQKVAACSTGSGVGMSGCGATSDLTSIRSGADTKRTLAFVGYGIAGATIVTGALLAYLNRPEAYQIRAEDLQDEHLTFAPIVSPTMAGASIQGHF